MIRRIARFFDEQLAQVQAVPSTENGEHALQLAAAVLLIEITRADHEIKDIERAAVEAALARAFDLDRAEIASLMSLAHAEAEDAVSLYDFTRRINDSLDEDRKAHLVELLWRVAYADGELDKYEEHLVRRVAELTYVPHARFVQAKHKAMERSGPSGAAGPGSN